jgi:hypothetical protein
LLRRQRDTGRGSLQPFHREFIGRLHVKTVARCVGEINF